MQIGVVGINHKLANLTLREHLARACQKRFGSSLFNQDGEHFFVLLSTCNRTEVYFSSNDLALTHAFLLNILRHEVEEEFDQKLYSYFGRDCFLHLARVTAGLDSAIIAETEIQGQVKGAYENAIINPQLPEELHYLFQKSLKVGKQVRSELNIGRGIPEIEHALYHIGTHFFQQNQTNAKVLFVGTSDINLKILKYFMSKKIANVTICNRSKQHAEYAAKEYKLHMLDWEQLTQWTQYDWVIFGTKAPEHLAMREHLPAVMNNPMLMIDLSVPRNVDPSISRHANVTLMNIDQINRTLNIRQQRLTQTLAKAESLIVASSHRQYELFLKKAANKALHCG